MNLYYAPDISGDLYTMSAEESKHLVRVMRMKISDKVRFTDGVGYFYDYEIIDPNPKACQVSILAKHKGDDTRSWKLQMAVAPTKNISRFEWFLEKATELGIDTITPMICRHSERKEVKINRLDRVVVAAMKQSLKSNIPILEETKRFEGVIKTPFEGEKYIAYIDPAVNLELSKAYSPGADVLILIGPEGDFNPKEVEQARQAGFTPVRLGTSRLRTETAAIVACHTIHLINQ